MFADTRPVQWHPPVRLPPPAGVLSLAGLTLLLSLALYAGVQWLVWQPQDLLEWRSALAAQREWLLPLMLVVGGAVYAGQRSRSAINQLLFAPGTRIAALALMVVTLGTVACSVSLALLLPF